MDLWIQVPGLSYFSIEIVLGLRQHTLWSFWVILREEGYSPPVSPVAMPGVPKSDRRPVWRRRRFFISSVDDSGLERSAVLESLCFGIGFGRLELNCNYYCYIIVLYFLNDIYLTLLRRTPILLFVSGVPKPSAERNKRFFPKITARLVFKTKSSFYSPFLVNGYILSLT